MRPWELSRAGGRGAVVVDGGSGAATGGVETGGVDAAVGGVDAAVGGRELGVEGGVSVVMGVAT
jgi:hypothetical protein